MAAPTLVTGAAGFAGGHLIDLLSAAGETEIVGWVRPGGHPPREVDGVRWMAVDLVDRIAVDAAIGAVRPQIVYHLAGAAHAGRSWSQVEATLAGNAVSTHRLLTALERANVSARVLLTSSAMVYEPSGEPIPEHHRVVPASPYGLSKLAEEMVGAQTTGSGIDVVIARPFNHFGPRQGPAFAAASFARQIARIESGRQDPEIVVGNLEARRDLTDVRDTVVAYQAIVERGRPGRPYNVCTGRAIAIQEVLDALLARARIPIRVRVDPARYQRNDSPLLVGDAGRIRSELGWEPRIPFDRTIDDLLTWWRGTPVEDE